MLKDKNGIIFGVANKRSIAWATAQALHEAGANLAFTYQGDRLKENVESLTTKRCPVVAALVRRDETGRSRRNLSTVGEKFGRLIS
jgi:enoyl-[acyl-carrier protein] reductase I